MVWVFMFSVIISYVRKLSRDEKGVKVEPHSESVLKVSQGQVLIKIRGKKAFKGPNDFNGSRKDIRK